MIVLFYHRRVLFSIVRFYWTCAVYDTATVLIFGDINGDGAIDAFDAVALDLANNGLHTLEKPAELAADINNDGVGISTADYAMLTSCVRCEARISQVR